MKSEIKVIPVKSNRGQESYEKGNCFERIIRNIIEIQQFQIDPNVQFAGLEIDLIATHKFDNNRTLYVECKAKEKVKSTELKNFGYNVYTRKPDQAYFIYTVELDKQASGLKKQDFEQNDLFKNVSFYGPEKIIRLLIDSKKIKQINLDDSESEITQQTLLVSYLGDYFIFIGQKTLAYPTHFFVYDAHTGIALDDIEILKELLEEIPELSTLNFQPIYSKKENKTKSITNIEQDFEIIAEIQAGDDWFDYKPASPDYFVGRETLKTDIFSFFKKVNNRETTKRAFYLKSNSGWGKSSLINSIKGTCERNYYRNRFYAVAYDCRSASTENFVAKAFEKAIEKTFSDGFIEKTIFLNEKVSFTSNYNLLDSDYIRKYLKELKKQSKTLIIIFDQFEDVFRKTHIFRYFYKFLSDIGEAQTNIIVGFSWKSEFLIQAESDTYSWFQQAKEQSIEFIVPEFGAKETTGIIKQLENSLSLLNKKNKEINNELKIRLTENSQGFPWLIKKLCIHILNQIKSGKNQDDLIDENLNIETLFKSDLSDVIETEQKALNLVASKAVSGNLFDETDISEYGLSREIKSLIDKRLIIRSGYNYNVYWDIFRDYLVTGQVPQIRRGYLFKQSPTSCLKIFLSFQPNQKMTYDELIKSKHTRIGLGALNNILIELRNLEFVKKVEGKDEYYIPDGVTISESFFKDEATRKIMDFSTYQKLKEIETKSIEISQITLVLKEIFKSVSHKENTWKIYSNYFANWLKYANLDISKRIQQVQKGRTLKDFDKEKDTLILRSNPIQAFSLLKELIISGFKVETKHKDFIRDCRTLKIIEIKKGRIILTPLGNDFKSITNENEFNIKLAELAIKLQKISECYEILKISPLKSTRLIEIYPHFFDGLKSEGTKGVYASKIISWARFLKWVNEGFPEKQIVVDVKSKKIKLKVEKIKKIKVEKIKKERIKKEKRIPNLVDRKISLFNQWLKNYELLVEYNQKFGHCNIPAREKYKETTLGTWVVRQRAVKNTLTEIQIQKLDEIGFNWEPNDVLWLEMYAKLKAYNEENGNSDVPIFYSEIKRLGGWVHLQRKNKKNNILKNDKIELLEKLEFSWDLKQYSFEHNVSLLKKYYEMFNHFNVPFDSEYKNLNIWINTQKGKFKDKKLPNDRINKLKEIGFRFDD